MLGFPTRFLSRPDVKKLKMAEFLDWCLTILNEADSEIIVERTSCILESKCCLFHREHHAGNDCVDRSVDHSLLTF